jgi:MscS family membrane protein
MRRAFLATSLLLALAATTWAQTTIQFQSPRELLTTFQTAAADGDLEAAASCFDLTGVDEASRENVVTEATADLSFLLGRIDLDLDNLPQPDNGSVVLNRYSAASGAPLGKIQLTDLDQRGWVVSSETLQALSIIATSQRELQQKNGGDEERDLSDVEAPAGLETPRASVELFLVEMNDNRIAEAAAALDLSSIPAVLQDAEGKNYAQMLFATLNRKVWVVMEDIPNDPDGDPYLLAGFPTDADSSIGKLELARGSDGGWRFTSQTIQDLPAMWRSVEHLPVLGGLKDVDQSEFDPAYWLKKRVPDNLKSGGFLSIETWKWLALALLLLASWLAGTIIRVLSRLLVSAKLRLRKASSTDAKLRALGRAASLIVNVFLVRQGLPHIGLPSNVNASILGILFFVQAFSVVWLLWTIWSVAISLTERKLTGKSEKTKKLVLPVLESLGQVIISIGVLFWLASQFVENLGGLIAGLGVGSLVIALAAKDSVENFFGSITVLLGAPFVIGDWVYVDGIDGTVEDIGLRTTKIRTFKDSVVVLPNSKLITAPVENYGQRRYRRLKTTMGLTYSTPPEKVAEFCSRVRDRLLEREDIWNDKRYIFFNDFGPSSLDIMVYCFIIAPDWKVELETRDEVLRDFMKIAEELGVEFAFPTRTIHIESSGTALPGDL